MTERTPSLLQFPCEYPLKVFGRPNSGMEILVLDVIRRHVGKAPELAVRGRPSRGRNYTALTVHFQATSRQQLDAIYQELSRSPEVLMAL